MTQAVEGFWFWPIASVCGARQQGSYREQTGSTLAESANTD